MKFSTRSSLAALLSCFIFFSTCRKESVEITTDDCDWENVTLNEFTSVLTEQQDEEYFQIWKAEFLRFHGLTEPDFDEKIAEYRISSKAWDGGISFRVDYLVRFGWLKIRTEDQFFVWMNNSWSPYHHHDIPRDTWLDANWVRYCMENRIHDRGITPVNWDAKLRYNDCETAVAAFRAASGYPTMEVRRVSFHVPGVTPRENGDPHLIGYAVVDLDANACASGNFNLVTGVDDSDSDPCRR